MTQKWNLQDIQPTEQRRRRPVQAAPETSVRREAPSERSYQDEPADTIVIKNGNREKKLNLVVLSSVVLLIAVGVFAASIIISKTTLTVYPEFSEPTVNAEFIAYPERRDGQLSYEIMTLTEEGERQVKATGQETVSEQATGFIEIIKSTPGTERLIKNTRFRSPDGLIYRIQESVVVPGAITDSTGSLVPGSIRASVFADSAGQEYNLPAGTKFDVPGFAESDLPALYNAIYAVNREAFTGGFNGPRFIIDEAELATAEQALQIELRNALIARVDTERPADFVAFPGAIAVTYNTLPTIQFGDNLVTIRQQAVLQQPLFKQEEFASYIASETIPTYSRESVRITNLKDLTFAYTDANTNAKTLANETALNFTILGKPQVVWNFDPEQLKADLAGKALTAISVVLSGHSSIRSAEISGKPFWKRSFPDSKDDIQVIEVIGAKN
jgi:hypothetical protein